VVVLLSASVGGRALVARHQEANVPVDAAAAAASPPPPIPSTTGSLIVPVVASVNASAPTGPFDAAGARSALNALASTLTNCKIPKGRSGRIKLTFTPDGRISSAKALAPYAGTPQGACVVAHLKDARVAPFTGRAPPYIYTFVVPR
jgi:hypothetical protein